MIYDLFFLSIFLILGGILYYFLGVKISGPPPLKKSAFEFPSKPLCKYVFLFVLDGVRYDVLMNDKRAPFVNDLARKGMVFHNNYVNFPSSTQQGIISFLTGSKPGLISWHASNKGKLNVNSLIDLCRDNGIFTALCVNRKWWGEFFGGDRVRDIWGADIKNTHLITQEVIKTIDILPEKKNALVVVHFEITDLSGHFYGAKSQEYLSSVALCDGMIKECYKSISDRELLDDSLLIITSDHGHRDDGGHGGDEEAVLHTPLIFSGDAVKEGSSRETANITDIAPSISFFLGTPLPDYSHGRILYEVIENAGHELISKYKLLQAERDYRQLSHKPDSFKEPLKSAYENHKEEKYEKSINISSVLLKRIRKFKVNTVNSIFRRNIFFRTFLVLLSLIPLFFIFPSFIMELNKIPSLIAAVFSLITIIYTAHKVYSKKWTFLLFPIVIKK